MRNYLLLREDFASSSLVITQSVNEELSCRKGEGSRILQGMISIIE